MPRPLCSLLSCLFAGAAMAQATSDDLATRVVRRHADHCHSLHRDAADGAAALRKAVTALLASPDAERLRAARAAWSAARAVYGQLEALRFHGGPIDGVEPLLNAWPIDESYIDDVAGKPSAGIVHDRARWPVVTAPLLVLANERGSETNVSVGWHAIEFLLWGQDLDPEGPGNRPFADFVEGQCVDADRRRAYLAATTDLLATQLADLAAAWAPGPGTFRARFVADPNDGVRRMLTGALILTAFELAGERLAVAYETRDQEQEHSCFSDTSCADLVANQIGIQAIFDGGRGEPQGDDLMDLIRAKDHAVAEHLVGCLAATRRALQAIPAPFDRACLGPDDGPGRVAIHAAITALEAQAEAIAIAGRSLGFDLPMRPGR